ncbi:hypothetical protein ACNKHN_13010 [Shigella flexneri]
MAAKAKASEEQELDVLVDRRRESPAPRRGPIPRELEPEWSMTMVERLEASRRRVLKSAGTTPEPASWTHELNYTRKMPMSISIEKTSCD